MILAISSLRVKFLKYSISPLTVHVTVPPFLKNMLDVEILLGKIDQLSHRFQYFHSKQIMKVRILPRTRQCLSYEGHPNGHNPLTQDLNLIPSSCRISIDLFLFTLSNL